MKKEKIIKNLLRQVNSSLVWFNRNGWVDVRRTPDSEENMVNDLADYVEARFNRELYDIPELTKICELLEGHLYHCTLEGIDESKRKFKTATLTLIKPEEIENPTPELIELINQARDYFGGSVIKFNCVRVKVQYKIEQ